MKSRISFFFIFSIIAAVAILHMLGLYFKLYWQIAWFDLVVHTLAAFWISYTALTLFDNNREYKKTTLYAIGLLAVIVLGFVWEVFEIKTGSTLVSRPEYIPDTIGDISADIIGSVVAILFYIRRTRERTQWNSEQN